MEPDLFFYFLFFSLQQNRSIVLVRGVEGALSLRGSDDIISV